MKRTYIIPEVFVVRIGAVRPIAQSVKFDAAKTTEDGDGGWVKENASVTDKSLWDNEW